jgi:hypothetical protein
MIIGNRLSNPPATRELANDSLRDGGYIFFGVVVAEEIVSVPAHQMIDKFSHERTPFLVLDEIYR